MQRKSTLDHEVLNPKRDFGRILSFPDLEVFNPKRDFAGIFLSRGSAIKLPLRLNEIFAGCHPQFVSKGGGFIPNCSDSIVLFPILLYPYFQCVLLYFIFNYYFHSHFFVSPMLSADFCGNSLQNTIRNIPPALRAGYFAF